MVAEFLKISLIFARFMSSRRSLMIFARFYELQALSADIFHVFMSSRRSLLIFARFYELQALTADIFTFL
jgi:hypothetical protein